ncbi:MAG: hypothetical protein O3A37_08300 [Planctomycetota bacterium]|nr:hypothetical protein [Planctomycetota bacterium]
MAVSSGNVADPFAAPGRSLGWPHLPAATKAAILAIVRDGRGER